MPNIKKDVNAVLIVAAGRGLRAGGELPKQYLKIGQSTVLRQTVEAFLHHPKIDVVYVVIHPDDRDLFEKATAGLTLPPPIFGGETRQASVFNGLRSMETAAPTNVLIHDGARPFVSAKLISNVLEALKNERAVLPALKVADTLKQSRDGYVGKTVDRTDVWRAQTPQGFHYAAILAAHTKLSGENLTDDCAIAEAVGMAVSIAPGAEENFKITTPEDVERARRIMTKTTICRIGNGFDVHRFCEGDRVTLCGISISHKQGLKGHSDADVALHALTDALMGSMALGDIGQHFPPSDEKWKGADSSIFIKKAKDLIEQSGGEIVNLDVTIICERPKIGPHVLEMRQNIASILGLSSDQVSVKATTTEGLGFTGREEGIAAQATASVMVHG